MHGWVGGECIWPKYKDILLNHSVNHTYTNHSRCSRTLIELNSSNYVLTRLRLPPFRITLMRLAPPSRPRERYVLWAICWRNEMGKAPPTKPLGSFAIYTLSFMTPWRKTLKWKQWINPISHSNSRLHWIGPDLVDKLVDQRQNFPAYYEEIKTPRIEPIPLTKERSLTSK